MIRAIVLAPLFVLFVALQPVLWIDTGVASPSTQSPAGSPGLPVAIASPDARVKFDLSLRSANRLAYRVTMKGRPVVDTSRLGIVVDGVNLGDGAVVTGIERCRGRSATSPPARARPHCAESRCPSPRRHR